MSHDCVLRIEHLIMVHTSTLFLPTGTDNDSAIPFEEILQSPIDLRNQMHKFAILDISQRLRANKWQQLARKLEIPNETIQQLKRTESVTEECYYQVFKEWLNNTKEDATFELLQDVLVSCNQRSAMEIVRRRLMSRGETL